MSSRFSIETIWKAKDRITTPVSRMQNRISKFSRSVESGFMSADRAASKFLRTTGRALSVGAKASVAGLGAIGAGAAYVTREFSKIEDAKAAFQPFMGSVEGASDAIERLKKLAVETPFQLNDLTGAAAKLFPLVGRDMDKMIKTLRMLGDISGGNADSLGSIATAYARVMQKGRTEMMELNMLNDRMVPIFSKIQEVMDIDATTFFKLSAAGRITSDKFLEAIKRMTSQGGMFFNAMFIKSKTTTGLWARLLENVALTAEKVGEIINPTVKEIIKSLTKLTEKTRNWLDITENRQKVLEQFNQIVNKVKTGIKGFINFVKSDQGVEYLKNFKQILFGIADGFKWISEHGVEFAAGFAKLTAFFVILKTITGVFTLFRFFLGPLGAVIGLVTLLVKILGELGDKFKSIREYMGKPYDFFFGTDPLGTANKNTRQRNKRITYSPNERAVKTLDEKRTLEQTEVTIKDETGRAEVTRRGTGRGFKMQRSGGM